MPEPVRQSVPKTPPRPRRLLEDRLIARWRAGFIVLSRALYRLPARARVRQALMRHVVLVTTAAHNRRDLEVTFALWGDDCVSSFPPEMGGLGSADGTRGREERTRFHRTFLEEWGELRYEVQEIVDAGDHLLVVGRMKGRGASSGAIFDHEWAFLGTMAAGETVREQVFLDHEAAYQALRGVGRDPVGKLTP